MSDHSPIEWTDATWNPLIAWLKEPVTIGKRVIPAGTRGWFCSKCSEGCAHCYAEKINLRLGNGLTYSLRNLENVRFDVVNLDRPRHWKEPRRVFVNSMTDLFHEAVPEHLIDRIFIAIALAPNHTFQVLTKRSSRMRSYLTDPQRVEKIYDQWAAVSGSPRELAAWPLPNVWLGVSVENQEAARLRIPHLLATPAAIRFLSCEPLLGPIDIGPIPIPESGFVDWIICGGESGRNARPMHPDWARGLRDACVPAEIPFFFKQWGEWLPGENYKPLFEGIAQWQDGESGLHPTCRNRRESLCPDWMHFGTPGTPGVFALRVGKKRAGRLLDGREWNQFTTTEF